MKDQAATVLCFEHVTIARDCMDTLQALGFNVIRIAYSAEVFTKLPFLNFDYLFSINFNPSSLKRPKRCASPTLPGWSIRLAMACIMAPSPTPFPSRLSTTLP